ncbi:Alpha/Beta hydrolase protein [Phaeosphaeria sp. MPI-PUGE-AT-0046c]|nr:Alpha/Beta hydrolase protein [Phaeosphaeria sp. MPI-PUGE-AT-0046c]
MSFSIRNTLALGAAATLAAAQTTPPKLDAPCADVVIFMARGNDAPYHDGRTTPFIDATCAKFTAQGKSCDYMDIQFDVTLGGDYCAQVAEGSRNGISQITAFNAKCPCTHIVVNGYSEGAHVVGDVLGGPGGCTFVSTGLDNNSAAGKAVGAALLWGDVMHTANQPYNVLDGASKAANGRSGDDLARLNRYSSVLRSYCAAGDPVCAGGNVVADHLNYFELYTDESSSWVVSKIGNTAPLCPTSTPTPTASSSAVRTIADPSGSPVPTISSMPAPSGTTIVDPSGHPVSSPAAPVSSPCSTSPVKPSPFPAPVPYNACVVVYEVKYVHV